MSINPTLAKTAKNLRLQKALSQNFLVDGSVLQRIADAACCGLEQPPRVVEIGAGAGFLTRLLLANSAHVTAVEVDSKMTAVLTQAFADAPHFTLLHQDIRHVDLLALLPQPGVIVGNIPYHLTGPIIFTLIGELTCEHWPLRDKTQRIVLMVQKEVGDRLCAKPGSAAYNALRIQAQFYYDVQPVCVVPKGVFVPPPKIDSMVVSLTPRLEPLVSVQSRVTLSKLLKLAFLHRRKTLWNNLKMSNWLPEEALQNLFDALGLSKTIRPQELTIAQYGALSDALDQHG